MSWQRVIEMARKQGMPIIVTDVAGREPMVVMPLEAYEAITEAPDQTSRSVEPLIPKAPLPVQVPVRIPVVERSSASVASELPRREPVTTPNPVVSLDSIMTPPATNDRAEDSELAMEERFYLEPVDEENLA